MSLIPNTLTLSQLLTIILPFVLILVFLLPSLIENRNPRDPGPRRILDAETTPQNPPILQAPVFSGVLHMIEEEEPDESAVALLRVFDILRVIPNMEAYTALS